MQPWGRRPPGGKFPFSGQRSSQHFFHAQILVPDGFPIVIILQAKVAAQRALCCVRPSGNHLAVFSEVWYGPNKGWQAYIDDKPVDYIRVNYLLRGLKIPAGQHKIVFEFKPRSFYLGETISNIASILLLTLAGFTIYRGIRQKNEPTT